MKAVQIFNKPMCCSTGVCGPQVDPVLPRFAAGLRWLKFQGHIVNRGNLAQNPLALTVAGDRVRLSAEPDTRIIRHIAIMATGLGDLPALTIYTVMLAVGGAFVFLCRVSLSTRESISSYFCVGQWRNPLERNHPWNSR